MVKERAVRARKNDMVLRKRGVHEYNINKLLNVLKPKPQIKKPKVVKKKTGKSVKKTAGPTYFVLIKRFLRELTDKNTKSTQAIVKHFEENYPEKCSRIRIKIALQKGVNEKVFVKVRGSYRLSSKQKKRADKPKKTRKSSAAAAGHKRKLNTPKKKVFRKEIQEIY